MEITKKNLIGIGISVVLLIISIIFLINSKFFFFVLGIAVLIGITPFIITIIQESRIASEKEEMFIEFARNLVESVKAGTPISKSIINVKNKPYGVLSPHIDKLANQIYLGVPLKACLQVFSRDVNNSTVSRALTLIGQAEREGGDIGEILRSVAEAVSLSDKLKKERKAAISTLVVQGYIIFFVFMIIILVMQFKILPMLSGIAEIGVSSDIGIGVSVGAVSSGEISGAFLFLLLIQGFFSGLAIGKLAEGSIKAGIKHSFSLMLISFLISTGASLFLK